MGRIATGATEEHPLDHAITSILFLLHVATHTLRTHARLEVPAPSSVADRIPFLPPVKKTVNGPVVDRNVPR